MQSDMRTMSPCERYLTLKYLLSLMIIIGVLQAPLSCKGQRIITNLDRKSRKSRIIGVRCQKNI